MKVAVGNWQNKANALIDALRGRGHEVVHPSERADAFLLDTDYPIGAFASYWQAHERRGVPIYLYTHGMDAYIGWDGIWKPRKVAGYLAMYPGAKEVMRRYGYPYPVEVIGWHYCALKPFQPCGYPKKILFAPWHPHQNGYLFDPFKAYNRRIHDTLAYDYAEAEITVRHLHRLEDNGIAPAPHVTYVQGKADNTIAEIDAADLVIGCGTFARLAMARGKPTILFGQNIAPHESFKPGHFQQVASWDKYRDYMRYPYEWDEMPGVELACEVEPVKYKERFVGEPFNPQKFLSILEGITALQNSEVVYA